MKDFAFIFEDGQIGIDWSAAASGIHNVKQKLINNAMTDRGTDEIFAARGTDLMRSVTGGGVYDLGSAQHALNFAALSAKRIVRSNEPPDIAAADKVADFTMLLDSVEDRKLVTKLTLATSDGASIGLFQQII